MVGTISHPLGDTDLPAYLAGHHGNARLLAGGDDLLKAKLAIAENGDKSNKHHAPSLTREPGHPAYAALVPHWCPAVMRPRKAGGVYLICNPTRQGPSGLARKCWAELSRRQGVLAWALRTTTDLAIL
jgi:hypothetical protein